MEQHQPIQFIPSRLFESFIAVARELAFRPMGFFEQLRPSGSLSGPLVFLLLCLFLSSLFVANLIGTGLALFAALFISWTVAMVLSSACLHVVLASPLFNVRLPYEATLSVVAYACIVFLVIWVPVLGIIANIYGLCLMFLGFKAVHRLSALRAGAAVFLMVIQVEFIRLMMLLFLAPGWMDTVRQALQNSTLPS